MAILISISTRISSGAGPCAVTRLPPGVKCNSHDSHFSSHPVPVCCPNCNCLSPAFGLRLTYFDERKIMIKALIILVVILVVPIFFILMWLMSSYNRLVALRNRYKNAFAQIDVQLKRRYDLIPNLVETAKGYIKHERGTLEAVIAARNAASSASAKAAQIPGDAAAMKELSGAETALTGSLGRLFA